jgi:recombination protein RecA
MRKLTGLLARQRICAVFTNQLRQNMKAMAFGDQYTEPGGLAFRFAASVRIRMKNIGRINNTKKQVIGRTIQAQVTKTRFGPTFRSATFDIHYDSGIQDLQSWLDYMKDNGLVTGTKAGYTFKMCDNQILKASEFVTACAEKPEFKETVYSAICDDYIMKYRPANSKIVEDVEHAEGEEAETGEAKEKE